MALLGAEEFSFGTAALIVLGCVMMRKCNLNTCPMGVATQDPKLRGHFRGDWHYLVNYFRFLAREVREYLAEMGHASLNEIVGHTELIVQRDDIKAKAPLDFSRLLHKEEGTLHFTTSQSINRILTGQWEPCLAALLLDVTVLLDCLRTLLTSGLLVLPARVSGLS